MLMQNLAFPLCFHLATTAFPAEGFVCTGVVLTDLVLCNKLMICCVIIGMMIKSAL
jgi:hypothetical protein